MPAEKGIPKPEASAKRLDVRDYDVRTAWGWLTDDERMIMSKEGTIYVDVELVCLSFDTFLRQYNLSINQIDGKRLLRWMRHIRDHQGKWDMDDIEQLECFHGKRMLSQNWHRLTMTRPKSSIVGFGNLATSVYNTRQIQKMGSDFQSLSDQTNTDSQMMLSGIKTVQDLQIASMAGIYQLQEQLDELSKSSWEILNQLKIADLKEEVLGSLKLFLIAVEEEIQNITTLSENYLEYATLMAEDLRNLMISSEVNIEKFKRMPSTTDIKWAKSVIDSVEELYVSLTNKL